ncbi:MAG TPA: acyl-CoA synthetase [Acidimicrobiales bacterium]|nr:acyl-CoA synthetase [Acidimicrobiales bacterium]
MALHFNLADLVEAAVDRVPERRAVVTAARTLTYAQLEDRANRLADWMTDQGIGAGDHVGCYMYNGTEFVETMLAAFKLRAVPINVNYRYVEDELRYLFNDADLKAIVHDAEFRGRVDAVRDGVPTLRSSLEVGGASDDYEKALAQSSPERRSIERSDDDHYVIYTGGTTGMPKGVVWRQADAFYACFGGGDYSRMRPVSTPEEMAERMVPEPGLVFLPLAPLMHGAAQWTVFAWLMSGGTNVLTPSRPRTDYAEVWRLITDEQVMILTIIGDAVARPLIDEYKAKPDRYDASSLFTIGSGGAPLSAGGRAELAATFPHVILADGYGASETGAQASSMGDGRFSVFDNETLVLDPDTFVPVAPGSGEQGRVARRGHIPIAYYNDPEKTAATFVERDGERWVLTGDVATVLDDGTIQLFGRGSMCINTGGEKVFPEEVEGVLVGHEHVYDAIVVGVPDDRWGERVTAVVQRAPGALVTEDELVSHCKTQLAGYKVPRSVVFVESVQRSPVGKADYAWAKQTAKEVSG